MASALPFFLLWTVACVGNIAFADIFMKSFREDF